jgi:alginate O-acetyltransferase complex protein AlgI
VAITKIQPPCSQLYFYSAWNPPFVILLWVSTLVDWYVAKALGAEESQNKRKLLLSISLINNLGLLGFF